MRHGVEAFGEICVGAVSEAAPVFLFGDAGGGAGGSDPRLRRVGCGEAKYSELSLNMQLEVSVFGGLPGPQQSVHRGDLLAFPTALTGSDGVVVFTTDNQESVLGGIV
eukprot:1537454-Pyramimonas_sp.AAC.1